ncbi:hypothetical protein [Actinocrinis sp.]|uniref:hypothetical protein n=1 Tax=Actinocrinis sp. TaxID=1920516 RepID=UPI002DDD5215|nr:hypothetical protein [Actinocrinis sp.]
MIESDMAQPAAQTGDIKAPIRVLLNPDTSSRITLIGTVHAAQPGYYQALGEIIDGIADQGGRIYAEQVTAPTPEQLASAPETLRFGADVIARMLADGQQQAKDIGLTLQKEALPVRDGWEVHDLDMLAVAAAYGEDELRRMDGELKQAQYMFNNFTPDLQRALLFQAVSTELDVATGVASAELLFPGINLQVATQREQAALTALDTRLSYTPDAHVALLWGAGHVPAFTKALAERGYKRDDEQWITAIHAEFTTPAPAAQPSASTEGN